MVAGVCRNKYVSEILVAKVKLLDKRSLLHVPARTFMNSLRKKALHHARVIVAFHLCRFDHNPYIGRNGRGEIQTPLVIGAMADVHAGSKLDGTSFRYRNIAYRSINGVLTVIATWFITQTVTVGVRLAFWSKLTLTISSRCLAKPLDVQIFVFSCGEVRSLLQLLF